MYFHRLLPALNLSNTLITQQTCFYSRNPFPNKVTQYLYRAKLIDSIRVSLRSNSQSLTTLLNHRILDTFVVTHALRAAPSAESAMFLIDTLNKIPYFSHNQGTLHSLATVLAKFQRTADLKSLVSDINSGRYQNVRFSFMNLMNWYAKSKDFESVLTVWNDYRSSEEKRVCTEAYNIMMNFYAQMGKDNDAVDLFNRMIHEGAIPNSRTYTVVIEHLLDSGKLDSAMEIFKVLPQMRVKRTVKHYVVLLESLVSSGQFTEAKALLKEMRDDGKFPSRSMLLPLHHMKDAGYVEETEEFLRGMLPDKRIGNVEANNVDEDEDEDEDEYEDQNVPLDTELPEVKLKPWVDPQALAKALEKWTPEVVTALEDAKFVWTSRFVCKVLRNIKSPETAWNFFSWVTYRPGFTHDSYSVERMAALLARHGHVDLVDKLISKVRMEGIKLSFSTIRLIIEFYGISKCPDAALKIFHQDRTLCGSISKFNQNLLYFSLLRTLTKCGRNSDALNLLDEMILNGICPDIQTFSGLMYHFALLGDIKIVQSLFTMVRQIGVDPDAYMFKVLIQAYCKCDRAALALRVFEDMMNSNLKPDVQTKKLLVRSLWKEGKRREAAAIEEYSEEIHNAVIPQALASHTWTVSIKDLSRVYNIYSNSFA